MSHAFETRTFTVSPPDLPPSFSSLEEFQAFSRAVVGRARDRTDGLHFIRGSTRSGWAIYLTKNLVRESPDLSALGFLTDVGQTKTFETEHESTAVSVLAPAPAPAGVAVAAGQLEGLLAAAKADPMRIYDADDGGLFLEDEVERALARDYVSADPAFDRQVRGDEGEGADYLCTYLRSVLALLRTAEKEGLAVVHVLKV